MLGVGGLLGTLIIVPLEKRFHRGILIPILLTLGTLGSAAPSSATSG